MKDEHVVQLLMACGELTRAIDEHKATLETNATTIAEQLAAELRPIIEEAAEAIAKTVRELPI